MNSTEQQKAQALVTFRLPNDDLETFDKIANDKRLSRSALLRTCVLETVKNYKD